MGWDAVQCRTAGLGGRQPADYIAKAVGFASDQQALATLRQDLQANLPAPLFNAEAFAKDLAEAFQRCWQRGKL